MGNKFMKTISIIGIGRLGGALAIALGKKGYEIENLFVRNNSNIKKIAGLIEPQPKIISLNEAEKLDSKIVFITTQDAEIENTASELENKINSNSIVFHTSGALSSEILNGLKKNGCSIGSLHPLVSISDCMIGATRFKNAYFCVEGDAAAVETAEKIVESLEGKSFSIETRFKALYHASAVTACGHLVSLIDVALEMLMKCGLEADTSKKTLLPLIKSTIENLENQTTAEALTGTFARADVKTFENHLASITENISPEAKEVYLCLGERSLDLAQRQGANLENLQAIRDKISLAKKNFKC